ncbi:hypothetical protein D9M71_121950 [compost metagenome]
MAHLDVALAQHAHLPFHQRHGIAGLVRDAHFRDQLVMLDEEFRMLAQVFGDLLGIERNGGFQGFLGHKRLGWRAAVLRPAAAFHKRTWPS